MTVRLDINVICYRKKDDSCAIQESSYYMEEAEQLCDEVAILHDKHITVQNSPQQIIAAQQTKTVEDAFVSLTGSLMREGWD